VRVTKKIFTPAKIIRSEGYNLNAATALLNPNLKKDIWW
jgi:hypothetical protein